MLYPYNDAGGKQSIHRIRRGLVVVNALGSVGLSMNGTMAMQRVGPIDLVLVILIVAGWYLCEDRQRWKAQA